jgi:hypothetical protein
LRLPELPRRDLHLRLPGTCGKRCLRLRPGLQLRRQLHLQHSCKRLTGNWSRPVGIEKLAHEVAFLGAIRLCHQPIQQL